MDVSMIEDDEVGDILLENMAEPRIFTKTNLVRLFFSSVSEQCSCQQVFERLECRVQIHQQEQIRHVFEVERDALMQKIKCVDFCSLSVPKLSPNSFREWGMLLLTGVCFAAEPFLVCLYFRGRYFFAHEFGCLCTCASVNVCVYVCMYVNVRWCIYFRVVVGCANSQTTLLQGAGKRPSGFQEFGTPASGFQTRRGGLEREIT